MYAIIHVLLLALLVHGQEFDWKIIGGQDATDGSHPYQVSIRIRGASHYCGGSIISQTCILTAAHCVRNIKAQAIQVVVGSNTLQPSGVVYPAECVAAHPYYNTMTLENDVAIITLSYPIVFNDQTVKQIALQQEDNVADGTQVILSGWGTVNYPTISNPNRLQELNFLTVNKETCKQKHRNIFDSQICAQANQGQGACYGDSGGPLVLKGQSSDGVDKQIGLISWGRPCAVGAPDVFTKVSHFADWIMSNCRSCFEM